jgi:hypothetical protein
MVGLFPWEDLILPCLCCESGRNMYSSEKVLQMSYANYQSVLTFLPSTFTDLIVCRGKEALVEKFKNSCIMDERDSWRPKIFYSDPGPNQGLPEPFPAPTHLRRKERSSSNRGALFVPGLNGVSGMYHHNHSHQSHRRERHHAYANNGDNETNHARSADSESPAPFTVQRTQLRQSTR